jgi:hypothetical protein
MVMVLALASWGMALDRPDNLGKAATPPEGFKFQIVANGNQATVSVTIPTGMEIYKDRLEVYGGEKIEYADLKSGSVITPAYRWYNLIFRTKRGNWTSLWTFLLVTPEYAVMPQPWFGEGVGVMPDFGKGCSLTYRSWLKTAYK